MPLPVNRAILAAGVLAAAAAGILIAKRNPSPRDGGKPVPVTTGEKPRRNVPAGDSADENLPRTQSSRELLDEDSQAMLDSLEELARRDPQAALAKMREIKNSEERLMALTAVVAGWTQGDPDGAAEWVKGLKSEDEQGEALLAMMPVWAAKAPGDAFSWSTGQEPGSMLRENALVELAETWGVQDPQEAFTRFLALESDDGSERGLHSIISQWALDAPQAAVDFLDKMEGEPRRDEMLQAALTSLASEDPEMAWKYAERFPDAASVEEVRACALEAMAESRPQEAIKLAESGGGSEVLMAGIVRGWASSDEEAARQWIASLPDTAMVAKLNEELSAGIPVLDEDSPPEDPNMDEVPGEDLNPEPFDGSE